jgi:hypothetical protein
MNHIRLSIFTVAALAVTAAGCDPHGKQSGVPDRSDGSGVADLSNNMIAMSAVHGISSEQSKSAPAACLDILLKTPADISYSESSSDKSSAFRDFYCSMSEAQLSSEFSRQVGNAASSGQSGTLGAELPIKGIPVKFSGAFNSNRGANYTEAMSQKDARSYRSQFCGDHAGSSSESVNAVAFQQIVSGVTLEKYNECVRVKQNGFFCAVEESSEGISAVIRWEPNETVRHFLPKVKLDWQTTDNLKLSSAKLPETVGIGTGVAVAFSREDAVKDSVLQVVAHDAGKVVNFACSRVVAKASKPLQLVYSQHTACGVMRKGHEIFVSETLEDDLTRPKSRIEGKDLLVPVSNCQVPDVKQACEAAGFQLKSWDWGIPCGLPLRPDVMVKCERAVADGYEKKLVKHYEPEERDVIKACLMDAGVPGVNPISEEEAARINDAANFGAG